MRVSSGRRSAVIVATLAAVLVLTLVAPAAAAKSPPGLQRFMNAIGKVESGGRYTARNATSGAYGKYQIMPSNWPSWADRYLGDARARQTAVNQDKVAAGKFTTLYRKYGEWRRVAYWWLTGSSRTSGWSRYATRYVNKVMRNYELGAGGSGKPSGARHLSENDAAVTYSGTWSRARHRGYAGDAVRFATRPGATATVTFTGTKIAWYGPTGPTRGQAKVSIDGRFVKTVDLQRRGFSVRRALFTTGWKSAGSHTLTIEVVGTKGHPMVAIDEFVVSR